jgi:hypothetical protein
MVPKMRARLECAKMFDKREFRGVRKGILGIFPEARKFDGSYGS